MSRWIPILVRAEDYSEVAALVTSREANRDDPVELPQVQLGGEISEAGLDRASQRLASYPSWPEEALRRLAASDVTTAQRWAQAMDVCASGEKTWYTTTEVAERSGMSVNEWRDAPRKLPRHLKVHYTDVPRIDGDLCWPLLAVTMPGSAEVSWAMTSTTRERWAKIRESARA